ncbi:Uncharacterized protein PECH_000357 [Penicillium ucsense]|uniref:Uncharacterized protein n=1 Tax=Penicillium ucsense TaxID=2839758 RepID=A0A8J8W255_9EURO|nr:Uncharacterized protein PECM_008249 [Penicillium ucsense]KAF7733636.1 Uncharacterized protein PECH_000357 [Penicillium ucsense]
MDAGGLSQMNFNNNFNSNTSLGVPGSGFASRGKGSHIKRLSVPPNIATIDESQASAPLATPRTSRSHLLAGLRTAPRSATLPPHHQQQQHQAQPQQQQYQYHHQQQRNGADIPRYASHNVRGTDRVPQTATGAGFPQHTFAHSQASNSHHGRPMYTTPEQVLAPPTLDVGGDNGIDENLYAELMSTNLFLAAQQQRLQQQLISVTAAAQQFQGLTLGGANRAQQQPMSGLNMGSGMGFYQQQLQQGVQPVVQPVTGQPGWFSVYNPLTGQQSYVMDNSYQEESSSYAENYSTAQQVPQFRAEISPPVEPITSPVQSLPPVSPPTGTPSPPTDSTAFRRNNRKGPLFNSVLKSTIDTTKANNSVGNGPRSAAFPPTPATGTFGPGQARAGEHPTRQPRGPPGLEELVAKPTSKHEGSKNFATRQRRRAVHSLVRAGIERRGDTRSFGYSSGGTNTPASEKEFAFSDGDDATVRSGSLSSKPSLGSLRAVANGAIGSERKEKNGRERKSPDSPFLSATPTGSEDGYFGSRLSDTVSSPKSGTTSPSVAAIVAGQGNATQANERRKTPMLVLSSAEKRKTPFV